MNTPRESFRVSGHAGAFSKLAASESFDPACDYAFLQLVSEMPPNTHPSLPTDPYVGFDANAQIQGARRVLSILRTIHKPVEQPKPAKKDTLHYD